MKVTKARKTKRFALVSCMVVLVVSSSVSSAQQASAQSSRRKEIRDPAEYKAYMSAVYQKDEKAMSRELKSFLRQYPDSVVKEDALEFLMGSYERTGDSAKAVDTGQELLTVSPCNLRALAVLTYESRRSKNLDQASKYSAKGNHCLQTATKPTDVPDEAWNELIQLVTPIFQNANSAGEGTVVKAQHPN
jgi:hypothetical protein